MQIDHLLLVRFAFRSVHRHIAECGIEAIKLADDRVVVIATELSDNPGMSITNAAEYVATAVCRQLAIDPLKLIWIEHYGYPVPGHPERPRTYDRVTFESITPFQEIWFHRPDWKVMRIDDWRNLGLPCPPDE